MGCANGSRGDGSDLVTTGLAGVLSLSSVFDLRDFTSGDGTEDDSELAIAATRGTSFVFVELRNGPTDT
jgi:hypothetical protein